MKPLVHIYCDGACSPNPGVGGWGAILLAPTHGNYRREISGAVEHSTNNRMELFAALAALRLLRKPCEVTIYTDSRYLRDAFQEGWIETWQNNGWRTSARKPVLNVDLWKELIAITKSHDVSYVWVRGHADDVENNRADQLAVAAREELRNTLRLLPEPER